MLFRSTVIHIVIGDSPFFTDLLADRKVCAHIADIAGGAAGRLKIHQIADGGGFSIVFHRGIDQLLQAAGIGDVYKRQPLPTPVSPPAAIIRST